MTDDGDSPANLTSNLLLILNNFHTYISHIENNGVSLCNIICLYIYKTTHVDFHIFTALILPSFHKTHISKLKLTTNKLITNKSDEIKNRRICALPSITKAIHNASNIIRNIRMQFLIDFGLLLKHQHSNHHSRETRNENVFANI